MEVTFTGAVLAAAGLGVFCLRPAWLPALVVFFVPFTATAILNFRSGFWLSPFQFFGILWMTREVLEASVRGTVRLPRRRGLSVWLLAVFVLVVLASMIMPLIIDGEVSALSDRLLRTGSAPVQFTRRNLTTPLYVIFGAVIAVLMAAKDSRAAELAASLKAYVWSGAFVAAWGLLQWGLSLSGVPYPHQVFNNSANAVAQGYAQKIVGSAGRPVARITSVAVETSIFAQVLLTAVALVLFAVLLDRPLVSRRLDRLLLGIMGAALLLSSSTSAYVGLAVLTVATLLTLSWMRQLRPGRGVSCAAFFGACLLAYAASGFIRGSVDALLFSKLGTASGTERLFTIRNAFALFQEYPILGLGWGTVTSHDLVVNLLANSGALGLASFLAMIAAVWGRLVLAAARGEGAREEGRPGPARVWAGGLIASMGTLLALQLLTGFTYGFGHFWCLLGLAIAARCALAAEDAERRGAAAWERSS